MVEYTTSENNDNVQYKNLEQLINDGSLGGENIVLLEDDDEDLCIAVRLLNDEDYRVVYLDNHFDMPGKWSARTYKVLPSTTSVTLTNRG